MAPDGYRSPRSEHGFPPDYPYPGTRAVDPRSTPIYTASSYQPPATSQYTDPRDHRDSVYGRPSASRDGYSSDTTRDSATYQTRYPPPDYPASSAPERPDLTSQYPPEVIAQIKADIKAEVLRDLKAEGGYQPESMARAQSAQPTYNASKPDYPTYPPPNISNYFDPMSRSPRERTLRPDGRGPPSPAASSDSGIGRPRPSRVPTSEPTALDKTWRELFDVSNKPTKRLGELLRGLANHIIADFEPKGSIVVTPSKMARYYEVVKIPDETCAWSCGFLPDEYMGNSTDMRIDQFKGRKSSSLSRLYRDLECQHHLVQDRPDEQPSIPGLTPAGFQKWMTILLRAYPDQEVMRLQRAIKDMPINNADDPKERFPKEINRRLFPRMPDENEKAKFERATSTDDDREEPKPVGYGNFRSESTHPLERERAPYFGGSESAVEDMAPPPTKLERERQPYSGEPGRGKTHDASARPTRANSTSKVRPTNIPPPPHHHRAGSNVGPNSALPSRRRRSPSMSFSDSYRHSEPDIVTAYDYGDEQYEREAEAKRGDWARKMAEEEAKEFGGPRERTKYANEADDLDDLRGRYDREDLGPKVEEYYRPSGTGARGRGAGGYPYDPPYPGWR
ncbi:MAG: hypothetical protein M1839_000514 [Geoglossum umbratile]|nr:MAG: hypothetical protein M1839_000514 [Geoglossum umbratile]